MKFNQPPTITNPFRVKVAARRGQKPVSEVSDPNNNSPDTNRKLTKTVRIAEFNNTVRIIPRQEHSGQETEQQKEQQKQLQVSQSIKRECLEASSVELKKIKLENIKFDQNSPEQNVLPESPDYEIKKLIKNEINEQDEKWSKLLCLKRQMSQGKEGDADGVAEAVQEQENNDEENPSDHSTKDTPDHTPLPVTKCSIKAAFDNIQAAMHLPPSPEQNNEIASKLIQTQREIQEEDKKILKMKEEIDALKGQIHSFIHVCFHLSLILKKI
jgi:hypothetical protein